MRLKEYMAVKCLVVFSTSKKVKVKATNPQCLRLCNPADCSPPDFFVHGILKARILEWVAIPFSRGSS